MLVIPVPGPPADCRFQAATFWLKTEFMNMLRKSVTLETSQAFYAKLGFEPMGGDADHGYLILKNGEHVIGLFQGMFENNSLTFNK